MNALIPLGNKILDFTRRFACAGPLLARLTVGWAFVTAGWGKIHNIERVIGFFSDLGIPAAAFQAHLTAYVEFLGGMLLMAGLASRIASVALGVIMIVALATALAPDIGGVTDLVGVIEFAYLVMLAWLAVAGPGKASLDALIARKYRSKSA
jgi:putative oxidoreductase